MSTDEKASKLQNFKEKTFYFFIPMLGPNLIEKYVITPERGQNADFMNEHSGPLS